MILIKCLKCLIWAYLRCNFQEAFNLENCYLNTYFIVFCLFNKYKCKHIKCHGRKKKYKKVKDKHNRLLETKKSASSGNFQCWSMDHFEAARKESSIRKVESMNSQKILDSCSVIISSVTRLLIYHCQTFSLKMKK